MRTIAELPHPECRITIFTMNQKFIVKIEQGNIEQVFKLAEIDITNGIDGLFQILDEEFIAKVVNRFLEMRKDFKEAYDRHEY